MSDFKNFSFKNVNVIWGIIEIEGYSEGDDVVSIVSDKDQFTKKIGVKGDVARSQTADNSCTITVKLLQTSVSNKLLMAAYNADRETGAGTAPLVVNDKETGETYVVNNAWITKLPDITRGENVNDMTWTLHGDFLTGVIV